MIKTEDEPIRSYEEPDGLSSITRFGYRRQLKATLVWVRVADS